jgi:hypothetical protein
MVMSLPEFVQNVKTAEHFLPPKAATDSSASGANGTARDLEEAAIWLSPGTVKGFDPRDFDDMPPDQLAELTANVERFRRVAERVPGDKPVPLDDLSEALPALRAIVDALQPNIADPEGRRVSDALHKAQFPDFVLGFDYRLDTDHMGDPVVWIWAIVHDGFEDDPAFVDKMLKVDETVRQAIRRDGIERWPLASVRTVSEQRSLAWDDEEQ